MTAYEALLEKISPKLASTHYLVLTVKKYLGDLYGFVKGYAMGCSYDHLV